MKELSTQELRIGNYLQDSLTKTTLEVIVLSKDMGIYTWVIDRSKHPLPDGWQLEPIPLNEKWLQKLGFTKHGKHGYFYIENFIIDVDMNGQFFMCDVDIHVVLKYVHSLQNLFFCFHNQELTLQP